MWQNRDGGFCSIYLVLSILTYTSLMMFRGTIPANKYQSSTYIDLSHPVIAGHALFSFGSSMCVCEDLVHTGATYSAIEQHMDSAVVPVLLEFVLHFEITNFFKRFLRVVTFILVFCMCCL